MQQPQTMTIDGKQYDVAKMSDDCKSVIGQIRFANETVQDAQLAMAQANCAKLVLGKKLAKLLPEPVSSEDEVELTDEELGITAAADEAGEEDEG